MASGYTINRSNYTLKKRRQLLSGGVVYERDFMTTTNLGGWDSGSIPYGEGNFKMTYQTSPSNKRNIDNGIWLKNDCSGETEFWTAKCIGKTGSPEESRIKIKPNYNSLLDFAYYGSCTELIKATITNIITNFPAELKSINGADYGFEENILQNNFNINLYSDIVPEDANPLRFFFRYYNRFEYVFGDERQNIIEVVLIDSNLRCDEFKISIKLENGEEFTVESRPIYGGSPLLFTDMPEDASLRPKEMYVNSFFEGLDDLSGVLLNRRTNPVYTAVLDCPYETEEGVVTYRRTFTWPSDGWNIEIEGQGYFNYLDGLLSLADFYDEYYTNNLWRMLTHDPIKTMDLTFSNPEKDEDTDDYNDGTSRLEGLFMAIGRQFDEIKRTIKNIGSTANISYDGNNNVPDYFLSDVIELGGFETYNIDRTLDKTETTEQLFSGVTKGYNADECNTIFLRNLKLMQKDIIKKKGTRDGIESLLGVFGMLSKDNVRMVSGNTDTESWDYEISEYVGVVDDSYNAIVTGETVEEIDATLLPLEIANSQKIIAETDSINNETLNGIPVENKYVEINGGFAKYFIPWFSKGQAYDGGLYFQSNGGWGKHLSGSTFVYDETIKYLAVVEKVSDLPKIPYRRVFDGMYVFVKNVLDNELRAYGYTEAEIYNKSNYFYIVDARQYAYVNANNGWTMVSSYDVPENKTIQYLNSIIDDYKANNPHIGFGHYDDGEKFIDYLRNPLKYSFDEEERNEEPAFKENAYDCNGKLIFSADTFSISSDVEDNMKCWYFMPTSPNGQTVLLSGESSDIAVGESGMTYESSAYTFDFVSKETGNTADEVTADSIINSKRIKITFYTENQFLSEFEDFLTQTVLPYLKQVIPSTAIFEYEIKIHNVLPVEIDNTTALIDMQGIDTIIGDDNTTPDDSIIDYTTDNDLTIGN